MRAHWRKEEWVLGVLDFWAGSCYTFFLACVTIRTNFLKCFAVRAVWIALQPQISVINVVSNLIWVRSRIRRQVRLTRKTVKGVFPSGISLYAAIVSLLEKRYGVRMQVRTLKRKLKNRPRKLRPVRRCFLSTFTLIICRSYTLFWILFTHVKPVKYNCVNYIKFTRQWKSTFISVLLNTKLRNMQHQIFSQKLLLKEKTQTFCCSRFIVCSSFSFAILNFIIMRTKSLYGINNKRNGVGIVRMYATTCVYFFLNHVY